MPVKWCNCCLVCRSNTLTDLSSDPETINLLSLDTATDITESLEQDEWWLEERIIVPLCASAKWYSCCLVCRSNTLIDLSEDPETINLLSLDTTTDRTMSMKRDEWRCRTKNDNTVMYICKVMQLLLCLQTKNLDRLVIRPRDDESIVVRHRN